MKSIKSTIAFVICSIAIVNNIQTTNACTNYLITPGAIKVGKGTGENLKVRWGREVIEGAGRILVGCKLNASSGNSNQEIFIATSNPDKIKEIINNVS